MTLYFPIEDFEMMIRMYWIVMNVITSDFEFRSVIPLITGENGHKANHDAF